MTREHVNEYTNRNFKIICLTNILVNYRESNSPDTLYTHKISSDLYIIIYFQYKLKCCLYDSEVHMCIDASLV